MGRLKVDKDEPLHLKTFIYISISSYNQLGRIQHHITAAYVVDTTSQCIHNASTSDTSDTGDITQPLWKYKITELRMILHVQYVKLNSD